MCFVMQLKFCEVKVEETTFHGRKETLLISSRNIFYLSTSLMFQDTRTPKLSTAAVFVKKLHDLAGE